MKSMFIRNSRNDARSTNESKLLISLVGYIASEYYCEKFDTCTNYANALLITPWQLIARFLEHRVDTTLISDFHLSDLGDIYYQDIKNVFSELEPTIDLLKKDMDKLIPLIQKCIDETCRHSNLHQQLKTIKEHLRDNYENIFREIKARIGHHRTFKNFQTTMECFIIAAECLYKEPCASFS